MKRIRTRMGPILGMPPGIAIAGALGLISLGLIAAVTLDNATRTTSPVTAQRAKLAPISTDSFARPAEGLSRALSADSDVSWLRHAAPFPVADPAPRLSIVIVDKGADTTAALSALRLPAPVTLAIAPAADSAEKRADAARRAGREVLLLLPMQAENRFDRTPNPIAIHVPRTELVRRINWNLAHLDGYVGVMNQFGEATTRDAGTMRAVMEVLQTEGLGFIDSRAHPDSVGSAVARRMGVPSADSLIAIDEGSTPADLIGGLAFAERHAERWGTAIISVPAERRLVKKLEEWVKTRRSPVKLTPVTAVIKRSRSGKS